MNVSDKKEFYIEDGEINEDHQTYEVLIDHAELVALENLENGGFNLSAIDEGVIDISIIPYVDNVQYSQYTKHITIETKHILTSTFVYHMYEKDSNQLLELDHGYYNLSILKTYYIDTMIDEYTTSKKLTYTSSDEKVITIDPDGNLVPVSSGIAKITLLEEKSQLFHTFQVKVLNHIELNKENTFTITGTNLVYDKDSNTYSMTNGFSGSIKLNFVSTSTYTHVSYFSSNEKVATIGSDGVITPLKVGKTTITLLCDDGIHEPIKVTINLSIERQDFIKDLGDFFRKVRKGIGHFGAFLVLGIFSTLTYLLYLNKKKMFFSVPINYAAGFALAAITEIIQLFVPGRYGAFSDVMLDFYGFLVSSTLITVVIITVEVINYIRHKKIK